MKRSTQNSTSETAQDAAPRERRVELEQGVPPSRLLHGVLRRFERAAPEADEDAWGSIASVLEGVRRAMEATPDGHRVSTLNVSAVPAPSAEPGRSRRRERTRTGLEPSACRLRGSNATEKAEGSRES